MIRLSKKSQKRPSPERTRLVPVMKVTPTALRLNAQEANMQRRRRTEMTKRKRAIEQPSEQPRTRSMGSSTRS